MVLVAAAAGPARADNAADRYREAMAMLLPPAMGLGSPAGVLSIDDLDTLAFLPPVPTAADRERLAPILAKSAAARALLEAASRIGRCEWELGDAGVICRSPRYSAIPRWPTALHRSGG